MPAITVTFIRPLNKSVQVGDNLYYSQPIDNQSGLNHPTSSVVTSPIQLGIITAITETVNERIGSTTAASTAITLDNTFTLSTPMGVHGRGIPFGTEATSIATLALTTDTASTLTQTNTPIQIGRWDITVGNALNPPSPNSCHYFFSKDNNANLTSLIGYYAEVELRNNSSVEGEMFRITTDFSESSR